ncbi:MerR family transcriptional regulator [Bogoriella caseilytica]|uniref:DNA-binding transcriptional MerR regulator n=1 Tax=Bogoriella caseilytica TaxID=56055 RepID=A0A3N2BB86_9MICO|nr:MerR family transcriptional regulator [Bogoriella caseilytica]ROR72505.1 DNA-binding transcriptional MerR regulator [Bogoriella caseilytica]
MRSAELARLAGITVRTLRHYHQVGVLIEPPRASNGYREYSIRDLVQVLRIRQLSGLGVTLGQMPALLGDGDGDGESAAQLLDELDRELDRQIEGLAQQRELIAQLRRHGASPDMPTELAPFFGLFAVAGYPQRVAQMDRDQAVLLSRFSGESGKAYLSALYEQLSRRPDVVRAAADFSRRFDALGENSSDEQIADLVGDFATALADVLTALTPQGQVIELGRAAELLDEYGAETYTEAQRRALALLAQRFTGSLSEP